MLVTTASKRASRRSNPDPVVLIRSSAYNSLPSPGNRVTPSDIANMPTIQASTGNPAFVTATGAHHYRLVGLNIKAPTTLLQQAVVTIGGGETTLGEFPTDITIDRCLVRGDSTNGLRRGVELDGIRCAIVDSYVSDCKEVGTDSQAVWAYTTPGPLKIVNNYLEAAGENVMLGGASSTYSEIPSDIEVRRNYFYKPLSWVGSSWTVKNHFEFKTGQRVLVEGNTFENVWVGAQNGYSLLVAPKNTNSWNTCNDLTIRWNYFKNCECGLNISGNDGSLLPQQGQRFTIQQNLVECANVNSSSELRLHQITNGPVDVQIINNTFVFKTGTSGVAAGFHENSPKAERTIWRDNIFAEGTYGLIGTGTGPGDPTFSTHFSNHSYTYNVMYGNSNPGTYTGTGNQFPASSTSVFTDFANQDYTLKAAYQGDGSDGLDPGVNLTTLATKKANSIDGQWGSEPDTYDDRSYTNAELPREYVNTKYGAQSGNTWTATNTSASSVAGTGTGNRTDCSLSYALANCAVGDTIILSAGSTYTGSWTLRNI